MFLLFFLIFNFNFFEINTTPKKESLFKSMLTKKNLLLGSTFLIGSLYCNSLYKKNKELKKALNKPKDKTDGKDLKKHQKILDLEKENNNSKNHFNELTEKNKKEELEKQKNLDKMKNKLNFLNSDLEKKNNDLKEENYKLKGNLQFINNSLKEKEKELTLINQDLKKKVRENLGIDPNNVDDKYFTYLEKEDIEKEYFDLSNQLILKQISIQKISKKIEPDKNKESPVFYNTSEIDEYSYLTSKNKDLEKINILISYITSSKNKNNINALALYNEYLKNENHNLINKLNSKEKLIKDLLSKIPEYKVIYNLKEDLNKNTTKIFFNNRYKEYLEIYSNNKINNDNKVYLFEKIEEKINNFLNSNYINNNNDDNDNYKFLLTNQEINEITIYSNKKDGLFNKLKIQEPCLLSTIIIFIANVKKIENPKDFLVENFLKDNETAEYFKNFASKDAQINFEDIWYNYLSYLNVNFLEDKDNLTVFINFLNKLSVCSVYSKSKTNNNYSVETNEKIFNFINKKTPAILLFNSGKIDINHKNFSEPKLKEKFGYYNSLNDNSSKLNYFKKNAYTFVNYGLFNLGAGHYMLYTGNKFVNPKNQDYICSSDFKDLKRIDDNDDKNHDMLSIFYLTNNFIKWLMKNPIKPIY